MPGDRSPSCSMPSLMGVVRLWALVTQHMDVEAQPTQYNIVVKSYDRNIEGWEIMDAGEIKETMLQKHTRGQQYGGRH